MIVEIHHIYSDGSMTAEKGTFHNNLDFIENAITMFIMRVQQSTDVSDVKRRELVRKMFKVSKFTKRLYICTGDDVHFFQYEK